MRPVLDDRIKSAAPNPAPRTPPSPAIAASWPAPPGAQVAHVFSAKDWFAIIVLSAIAILIGLIIYKVAAPSESKTRDQAVSTALYQCQRAIHSTAQYGGADTPPFAKNYGKGDEFYFAWPRGSFEFANGFGAHEKMSASCNGILSTGEIKGLTVNGKNIL
jgi:hypothetical protein